MRTWVKIAIIILIIASIVGIVLFIRFNNKHKLEEYVKPEYNYFAMYSTDDKVGVIDKKGKVIIKPEYYDVCIPNPSKPVFVAYTNTEDYKFINEKGEELYKDYEDVTALQTSELTLEFENYFLRFKKDGKYGLLDFDGNIVVKPDYDSLESLKNRPGEILAKKGDKCGVIGSDGKVKIDFKYDSIIGDEFFTDKYGYGVTGYIVGKKTSNGFLYGYLNNYAEEVLDVNFESISRVLKYNDNNSYLIVMNNGKKGVYKNSKLIIAQNYQQINYTDSANVFIAKRNSHYGIFKIDGKPLLDVKYKAYSLAGNYIYVETDNGDKELYDVNGNKISNLNFKSVQTAGKSGTYIAVDESGFYSIITGEETISGDYTYLAYAYDNYFIFRNSMNKYGLYKLNVGVVLEPNYAFMLKVNGKNAIEAVRDDGVVEIYSKDIQKTVEIAGAVLEEINDDYTIVHSNSESSYIDKNGNVIPNTEVYKDNKIYAFKENDRWGYKNKEGKIVIEAMYDYATDLNSYGFAGIRDNGKWGMVDSSGKVIEEPNYVIENDSYIPIFVGKYMLEITSTYHCIELD